MSYRPTLLLVDAWTFCQLQRVRTYSPPWPPWGGLPGKWVEEWENEPPPFTHAYTEEWENTPPGFTGSYTEEWG